MIYNEISRWLSLCVFDENPRFKHHMICGNSPFSWKIVINTSVSSAFVQQKLKPLIIPLMTNERFYFGCSVCFTCFILLVHDMISFHLLWNFRNVWIILLKSLVIALQVLGYNSMIFEWNFELFDLHKNVLLGWICQCYSSY